MERNILILDRGNYRVQKYDKDGKYLQTNGCIYSTEFEQDTGYTKIKRFKIKNWKQIREGR